MPSDPLFPFGVKGEGSRKKLPDNINNDPSKVKEPPPSPRPIVVLSKPRWVDEKGIFNKKGIATVNGTLPPESSPAIIFSQSQATGSGTK